MQLSQCIRVNVGLHIVAYAQSHRQFVITNVHVLFLQYEICLSKACFY